MSYRQELSTLLRENRWAFWNKGFWTHGSWARRDSELQKILARIYGVLDDVLRIEEISDRNQKRIEQFLNQHATTLTLDAALEVFDGLDRIMIEIGAASSLVVLMFLASAILDIAGTGSLEGKAAIGFLAGFSEPFFLKMVGHVARWAKNQESGMRSPQRDEYHTTRNRAPESSAISASCRRT